MLKAMSTTETKKLLQHPIFTSPILGVITKLSNTGVSQWINQQGGSDIQELWEGQPGTQLKQELPNFTTSRTHQAAHTSF